MLSTTKNNIHFNARFGLANGIHLCREAVETTLGGAGRNLIIKQENYPYYISTKDAFSIIQAIRCEDPLEKQAVDMMKDATDSMNKIAKDGRTAMCILTDEILQNTFKEQADPIKVEKEINELLPFIESEIDKQTRTIGVEDIENVARTASNSDRIAKIVSDIYKEQGKDCIINHIEGSGTLEDYFIPHTGVRFQGTGFLTESFVHDEEAKKDGRAEKKAVYEKPTILVTKRKISSINDIDPLLQNLEKQGKKDLIIFTDDMDSNVATILVDLHKSHVMNICIIKAPVLWKDFVFEDFAKCVGATIVEDSNGLTFKNLTLEHLGTCDKTVIDKEECILTGTADLTEHIKDLKAEGSDDSLRRVWWLTTKTATIRLGATNEGELSNLRLACQDAVYSCQAALQHGIVAGGGVCLKNVGCMSFFEGNILREVLKSPFFQIVKNSGNEGKWTKKPEKNWDISKDIEWDNKLRNDVTGYDAKKQTMVKDMFEAGIVDSALVIKNQIRQAIKIASIALKTDKLIDIPKMTLEEAQIAMLQAKRTPF